MRIPVCSICRNILLFN